MERDRSERSNIKFDNLDRLKPPTFQRNFQEWKEERLEGKYHVGFVVGVVLSADNPKFTTVYFDGGRRRVKDDKQGIVLEGVHINTHDVVEQGI